MASDAEYLAEKLKSKLGSNLADVYVDKEGDCDLLILNFVSPNGVPWAAALYRDPEGNGPGWLDIQEE